MKSNKTNKDEIDKKRIAFGVSILVSLFFLGLCFCFGIIQGIVIGFILLIILSLFVLAAWQIATGLLPGNEF